jgi:hypothetical protein
MTDEELETYRRCAARDFDLNLQTLINEIDRLRAREKRLVVVLQAALIPIAEHFPGSALETVLRSAIRETEHE